MGELFYTRDKGDGRFLLHDSDKPDQVIYSTSGDRLAMIVDPDESDGLATMHKHGSPESLAPKFENMVSRLRAADAEWADRLKLVDVSHWPLEVINRCLSTSGFVGRALAMYGEKPEDVVDI